jgi:hypothetical protein
MLGVAALRAAGKHLRGFAPQWRGGGRGCGEEAIKALWGLRLGGDCANGQYNRGERGEVEEHAHATASLIDMIQWRSFAAATAATARPRPAQLTFSFEIGKPAPWPCSILMRSSPPCPRRAR